MIHGAVVARWAGNPEVPGSIPGGLLFGVQYICVLGSDFLCSDGLAYARLSKGPYALSRTCFNMISKFSLGLPNINLLKKLQTVNQMF